MTGVAQSKTATLSDLVETSNGADCGDYAIAFYDDPVNKTLNSVLFTDEYASDTGAFNVSVATDFTQVGSYNIYYTISLASNNSITVDLLDTYNTPAFIVTVDAPAGYCTPDFTGSL